MIRVISLIVGLVVCSGTFAQTAPTYVGTDSSANGTASSRTLTDATIGGSDGDLYLGICNINQQDGDWTDPTDWTELDQFNTTGATPGLDVYIGYKVRSGTGQALTFSYSGTANNIRCSIVAYSNIGASTWDVTYSNASHYSGVTANTPNISANAITTNTNNAAVVLVQFGTQSISGAAGPPSGYTQDADWFTGAIGHANHYFVRKTVTTAGTETPGAFTHTDVTGTMDSGAFTLAIQPASSAPSFTAGPTVQSRTDAAYTISYTADSSGDTVYFMLLDTVDGATPPSCNDIESTTGSHGAANEATTGSADTIVVTATDSPEFPYYDIFGCIERATDNDSAVSTLADETLNEPTGRNFVTITSIGTGSPCEDFNALAATDIAANDVILLNETTDPTPFVFTLSAACQGSYSGDGSRQSVLNSDVYDDSVGGWNADDLDMWFNNQAPVCDDPVTYPFDIDAAWTTVSLTDYCTDAEGDTITFTTSSGSLPAGLSLSTPDITGDPTTENEAGISYVALATDIASDTDTQSFTWYPIDSVTMPTLTDSDLAASLTDELTSFPWRAAPEQSATFVCSIAEALGQVLTQDPAASTEVAFDVAISITVSLGSLCEIGPGIRLGPFRMQGF